MAFYALFDGFNVLSLFYIVNLLCLRVKTFFRNGIITNNSIGCRQNYHFANPIQTSYSNSPRCVPIYSELPLLNQNTKVE